MRVHHIALSVMEAEKSINFYNENFGFSEVQRFTKPGWDGVVTILQLGDLQLEIFHFKGSRKGKDDASDLKITGLKHISLQVASVNKKYKDLKEKGVDIDAPVKGTTCAWFCFLRDPDGMTIELYESK